MEGASFEPETLLEKRQSKSEWASGVIIVLLMLAAFALAGRRIYAVATGPLPPGPGVHAPHFNAPALADGASVRLDALHGKVVLLDFWATWCPPCVASLPGLQKLHEEFGDQELVVLGVNQEPGAEDGVRTFLRRRGLSFPSVVDSGAVARSYGVYSFPTSFLIDRRGEIRRVYRGPASESRLRGDIEALLREDAPRASSATP